MDNKKKATETTARPVNSASTSKTASMLNTTSQWNTTGWTKNYFTWTMHIFNICDSGPQTQS